MSARTKAAKSVGEGGVASGVGVAPGAGTSVGSSGTSGGAGGNVVGTTTGATGDTARGVALGEGFAPGDDTGAGRARGRAGGATGAGLGSPNPGGRIDSGPFCPAAGIVSVAASTAVAKIAGSARLLLKVRKRHGLFDMLQRLFMRHPRQREQAADQDGHDDEKHEKQAGHGQDL
jgi:hypothetical protein